MRREIATSLALAGFLAGCASPDAPQSESEMVQEGILPNESAISESIYTPDGRRITLLPSVTGSSGENIAVTEYCSGGAGGDLITITDLRVYRGAAGGVDRSVGHVACVDGVLTAADFPTQD